MGLLPQQHATIISNRLYMQLLSMCRAEAPPSSNYIYNYLIVIIRVIIDYSSTAPLPPTDSAQRA